MIEYCDNVLINKAKENKIEILNSIKILVYKEDQSLSKLLDFEDDDIFFEPLLFAYFNSKKLNLFSDQLLKEILFGSGQQQSIHLKHSFNDKSVAYIPKLGYYKKSNNETILEKNKNDFFLDCELKIEGFEILKYIHPVLKRYFTVFYRGEILDPNPIFNENWQKHIDSLEIALKIIKQYMPDFFEELQMANKRIFLHENTRIINFTTIETLGMLYFNTLDSNNEVYFIEELIHQGSHNFFNILTYDKESYYKIDVGEAMLKDYGGDQSDYRTIHSAFHGLYTVTKRAIYFDRLIENKIFSDEKEHELFGRLTDQFRRYRTGLQDLYFDKVFTDKGYELYTILDQQCQKILTKYEDLKMIFDLSNRDVDFRYTDFCKLNSLEDFFELKKSKKLDFKN